MVRTGKVQHYIIKLRSPRVPIEISIYLATGVQEGDAPDGFHVSERQWEGGESGREVLGGCALLRGCLLVVIYVGVGRCYEEVIPHSGQGKLCSKESVQPSHEYISC